MSYQLLVIFAANVGLTVFVVIGWAVTATVQHRRIRALERMHLTETPKYADLGPVVEGGGRGGSGPANWPNGGYFIGRGGRGGAS